MTRKYPFTWEGVGLLGVKSSVDAARTLTHLHLVKLALVRLHDYYVFWDGFGSLAAKTRGLVEHDRILNCEHRSERKS